MTPDSILKRCGASEGLTPTQSVADDCALYARAGFGAIGMWLHKLERIQSRLRSTQQFIPEDTIAEAAAAVRRSGLEVSHLVLAGFYTLPDRESRIAHTLHAMEVATALGAKTLVVAPGRRAGRTYEETRDYTAGALDTVFERATTDMTLALGGIHGRPCKSRARFPGARRLGKPASTRRSPGGFRCDPWP